MLKIAALHCLKLITNNGGFSVSDWITKEHVKRVVSLCGNKYDKTNPSYWKQTHNRRTKMKAEHL